MKQITSKTREIFNECLDLEGAKERNAYLESLAESSPQVAAEVRNLLQAHDEVDGGEFFAPNPRWAGQDGEDRDSTLPELGEVGLEGSQIGRYRLLEKIGEGGMGSVYMAEQEEPVRRKVALKIIKLGMDTKQVVARFEAERQALAMMDNPNIAKLLDAGVTETGRPYFVMELVRGVSITKFCDENQLSLKERLQLFIPVCHAIQHAHQKGVIHRDIKPSNILVTSNAGTPHPMVIDFGVAKATNQRLTEKTLFTRFAQMVGTPAYMSPEQAEMSIQDVDTRSDVYSLGILLYELLTGTTPFPAERLRSVGYAEIQRIIKEEEPLRPSTMMSQMDGTRGTVSASRSLEPAALIRSCKGDLDWIVLKAIEKDRKRRYESASGLAEDVVRHLDDEPVTAAAPTWKYQFQKFYHKHRIAFRAAAALGAVLVIATAVSTVMAIRSNVAERKAEAASKEARAQAEAATAAELVAREANEEAAFYATGLERQVYLLHIAKADTATQDRKFYRARVELDACAPELRGWEWDYLEGRIRETFPVTLDRANLLTREGREVLSLTSPEGARYLVRKNRESGEILQRYRHDTEATVFRLSHRERQIVVATRTGDLVVWDTRSGEKLWSKPIGDENRERVRVHSLEFSPDDQLVACNHVEEKLLVVCKVADGSEKFRLRPFEEVPTSISFSPDSRWIICAPEGGSEPSAIIDLATGKIAARIPGSASVAFAPVGQRVATTTMDGRIKTWNWDGETLDELKDKGWRAADQRRVKLVFDSSGTRLASAVEKSNLVTVWDAETGEELETLETKSDVWGLRFRASWGRDSSLDDVIRIGTPTGGRYWRWRGGRNGTVVRPLQGAADVKFSPGGDRILASTPIYFAGGSMYHWQHPMYPPESAAVLDSNSGALVLAINEAVYAGSWVGGGEEIIATPDASKLIRSYDAETGKPIREFPGHTGRFTFGKVDTSGRDLVSFSSDTTIRRFNYSTGALETWGRLVAAEKPWRGVGFDFSQDLEVVALGGDGPEFRETRTGKSISGYHGQRGYYAKKHVFTPDGKQVYVGSSGGSLMRLNVASGEEEKRFIGHAAYVFGIAISPDGTQIVAGDSTGQVIVWDVASGQPLVTLCGGPERITSVDWSADGKRIVAGKMNGTVQIWTLPASP